MSAVVSLETWTKLQPGADLGGGEYKFVISHEMAN